MTRKVKTGYAIMREKTTAELREFLESQRGYKPPPAVWRKPPQEPTETDGIVATVLRGILDAVKPVAKRRAA